MLRLYQFAIAHHTVLKAIFAVALVTAMALGISADAAAEDSVDP